MYVKKVSKGRKYELCAEWVMNILKDYHGVISFMELRLIGSQEGYSRQDIYNTLSVIEKKIVRGGNGRLAIWYTVEKYKELGEPKGVIDFLQEKGYKTTDEYIKDNGFNM